MYFAVIGTDRPGAHKLRAVHRPAHREWLRHPGDHPIVVRHGGPLLNQDGGMDGTLLIVEAPTRQSVERFLAEDPYALNDIFEKMEIREWLWSLGGPTAAPGDAA